MAGGSEPCPLSELAIAISISSMNAPHLGDSIGWRARIAGLAQQVPLADGRLAPYINLDNAATTPPLQEVLDAVHEFLPYYSSVHRGAGFKSRVSTAAYDQAHETIARFVGADPSTNTVIFGKNTTEAINKLAYRYPLSPTKRRALDRDGTSLERPALARASPGRASQGHQRRTARRRRRRPTDRGIRRSHRPADGERRVERHRLRAADPSAGAKGSRRRRKHPGRRCPTRTPPPNRRQGGSRPRASRFRGLLGAQDVRAVRHRCARRTT